MNFIVDEATKSLLILNQTWMLVLLGIDGVGEHNEFAFFLLQGVILYHIIQKKFPTETGVMLVGSGRGLGFCQK